MQAAAAVDSPVGFATANEVEAAVAVEPKTAATGATGA